MGLVCHFGALSLVENFVENLKNKIGYLRVKKSNFINDAFDRIELSKL